MPPALYIARKLLLVARSSRTLAIWQSCLLGIVNASESLFGAAEDSIASADAQYNGAPPDEEGGIQCPTDFSNYSVPECDTLDPQLVDACYFDVILGGPQFLDDIQYLPACGNNTDQYCSYHGECVADACQCDNGWTGKDCETRVCPTECETSAGSTGTCRDDGICDCRVGFTGQYCQDTVSCEEVNDCNAAAGRGVCVDTNTCECTSLAYELPDCSAPSVPSFTFPPSPAPTPIVTDSPTPIETDSPTPAPTAEPTAAPTPIETDSPTPAPTADPTAAPTPIETDSPTQAPTADPTAAPTPEPTASPTLPPTAEPTPRPTPGNTAIDLCTNNERDGFCISEDDTITTASVVCCRETTSRHAWDTDHQIECVNKHSVSNSNASPRGGRGGNSGSRGGKGGGHGRNNWGLNGRNNDDRQRHSQCFPTEASYAEAEEFCEGLEIDGFDDWRLCSLDELAEEGACCVEDDNQLLLGSDDNECEITSLVWASDSCVPLPSLPNSNNCDCNIDIAQVRADVYAEILNSAHFENLVAEEVAAQLNA